MFQNKFHKILNNHMVEDEILHTVIMTNNLTSI